MMRFETSQNMKLGQQMKLAPRMIQSMEILQMSLAELEERIEQELAMLLKSSTDRLLLRRAQPYTDSSRPRRPKPDPSDRPRKAQTS